MKNLWIFFLLISLFAFGQKQTKGIQAMEPGKNTITPGYGFVGDHRMVQTPYIIQADMVPKVVHTPGYVKSNKDGTFKSDLIFSHTPGIMRIDQNDGVVGFGSPAPSYRLHVFTEDTTNYDLDIAGNAKIKERLVVLGGASFDDSAFINHADIRQLNINLNDGPLHISENMVFSGPLYKSEVAEIEHGRILYGNDQERGKTNPLFYYNDSTETLVVPNITVTGSEFFKPPKVKKINKDFLAFTDFDYILADASDQDVNLTLSREPSTTKTIVVKRANGKHRVTIHNATEKIILKNNEPIKLLYDGENWHKVL